MLVTLTLRVMRSLPLQLTSSTSVGNTTVRVQLNRRLPITNLFSPSIVSKVTGILVIGRMLSYGLGPLGGSDVVTSYSVFIIISCNAKGSPDLRPEV